MGPVAAQTTTITIDSTNAHFDPTAVAADEAILRNMSLNDDPLLAATPFDPLFVSSFAWEVLRFT
jgi:hypothetical protein